MGRCIAMSERREIGVLSVFPAVSGVGLIAVLSLILDVPFRFSTTRRIIESPFIPEETAQGALANSIIFLGLVILGTAVFILIIKFRKVKLLPIVFSLSIFFSFFAILELFLIAYSEYLSFLDLLVDPLSVIIPTITALLVYSPKYPRLLNGLLILYGVMAGALFSELLPVWSVFAIALIMSIYDIYAVFRGPLKYILENLLSEEAGKTVDVSKNPLRGASIQMGPITLGMGDVLMYSMLSPVYFFTPKPSIERWLVSVIGLIVGFIATLYFLRRKRFMPALPLPVFTSLTFYLAARTIL